MIGEIELPEDCFACEHSILCGSAGDFCLLTGKPITLIQDELDEDCPLISDTFLLTDISTKGKIRMISAKELRTKYAVHSTNYYKLCNHILLSARNGVTKVVITLHNNYLNNVDMIELRRLEYSVLVNQHDVDSDTPNAIDYTISW